MPMQANPITIQLPERLRGLPVAARLADIDFAAQRFIAKAETGAGKSMCLAPYEAMLRKANGEKGCIAMRCPTKLTGQMVASGIRDSWSPLGLKVAVLNRDVREGSAEEKACRDADLVLISDGSLARLRRLAEVAVYYADEAHWPSLAYIIELAGAKAAGMKIRLLSATVDEKPLLEYLGPECRNYFLEGRTFPIDRKTIWASPDVFKRDDHSELYLIVKQAIDDLLREGKSAIFFLPVKAMVEDAAATFAEMIPTCFLHGGVSPLAAEAWMKEHEGKPWAAFATTAASTGITLSADRSYVADQVIESVVEHGVERTQAVPMGDNGALQAFGRVGRIRPGEAFLITHPGYRHPSNPNPAAGMVPQPIISPVEKTKATKLLLAMAQNGIHADEDLDILGNPDPAELRRSRQWLIRHGCLNHDGTLTKLGHAVANFPMEAEVSHLVLTAPSTRSKLVLLAAFCLGLQGTHGMVKVKGYGKTLAEAVARDEDFKVFPVECLVKDSAVLSLAKLMAKTCRMEPRQLMAYCDSNNLWGKSLSVARKDFGHAAEAIFRGGSAQALAATDFDDSAFAAEVHGHLKGHPLYRFCEIIGDTQPGRIPGKFDSVFAYAFGYSDGQRGGDGKVRMCWSIPSMFRTATGYTMWRLDMGFAEPAPSEMQHDDDSPDIHDHDPRDGKADATA